MMQTSLTSPTQPPHRRACFFYVNTPNHSSIPLPTSTQTPTHSSCLRIGSLHHLPPALLAWGRHWWLSSSQPPTAPSNSEGFLLHLCHTRAGLRDLQRGGKQVTKCDQGHRSTYQGKIMDQTPIPVPLGKPGNHHVPRSPPRYSWSLTNLRTQRKTGSCDRGLDPCKTSHYPRLLSCFLSYTTSVPDLPSPSHSPAASPVPRNSYLPLRLVSHRRLPNA